MADQGEASAARRERTTAWISLGTAILALGFVGLYLYQTLGAPPDRVAAPFTRVGGDSRVETALEVSRFWSGPDSDYVAVRATAPPERVWAAAECALQGNDDGVPLPLLYLPTTPSQSSRFEREVDRLGGERRKLAECPAPTPSVQAAEADCDEAQQATWSVYSWGEGLPLRRPAWAPCSTDLHPTVVVVAEKSARSAPDVPVALLLAAWLSDGGREISVLVVPPFLEADVALEESLRTSPTEVESGVILSGTIRIPDDTRLKLRSILVPRRSMTWVEQLEKGLGPMEAALLALATLFGVRQIPHVAPLVEGGADVAKDRWRRAREWQRGRGTEGAGRGEAVSHTSRKEGDMTPSIGTGRTRERSATAPETPSPWERWQLGGAVVRVELVGDETWTGTVDETPQEVEGVVFLAIRHARLVARKGPVVQMEETTERPLDLVLIRWEEVRRISRGPVETDSPDTPE